MTIRTYDSPKSLQEFGIYLLTGEACGLSMRGLFDLSKNGKAAVQEFLRVSVTSEPWNSMTDGNEHVASVMLPYSILEDLWIFCQVRRGAKNVFKGGYVSGNQWVETKYESIGEVHRHPCDDWQCQAWAVDNGIKMQELTKNNSFYIKRWYAKSTAPGTGLDNEHAMSGRVK